jgi:hypothetical protein
MAKVQITNRTLQVLNILQGRKKNSTLQLVPKQSVIIEKSEMSDHMRSLVINGTITVKDLKDVIEV